MLSRIVNTSDVNIFMIKRGLNGLKQKLRKKVQDNLLQTPDIIPCQNVGTVDVTAEVA